MRIFIILLLLYTGIILRAQEDDSLCVYTLYGRVIDEHDGMPLEFATIQVSEANKTAIGDSLGFYEISGLCKGEYTVICSHIGCEPVVAKVRIRGNTERNFYPEHHEEELQAVKVTGERRDKHPTHSAETLDSKKLDRLAGESLGDILDRVAGVSTLKTGPGISKPVIHGMHGSRILIMNNGIRQEDQQWGAEHAPEIDPFIANRITVVKGAGAVRYGSDAIGGVILVDPPGVPVDSGFSGDIYAAAMSNGRQSVLAARLQRGCKKIPGFGWRIQGSGSIAGDRHSPDYVLSNTGSRSKSFSAATGLTREKYSAEIYYSFTHRRIAILRASHTGNLTDLQNAISADEPWYIEDFTFNIDNPRQDVMHHLIKAKSRWRQNSKFHLTLQYGYQMDLREEYDTRRGGRSEIPSIDLRLQTHSAEAVAEHSGAKGLSGSMGAAAFYQQNYNVPGTGIRPLIPNYSSAAAGLFIVEKIRKGRWEAEAGARYDYKVLNALLFDASNNLKEFDFHFHNIAASAGAAADILKGLTVRTNAGLSFRPPNVSELFSEGLHHGAAAIEEGNVNLDTEKGFKWTAGADYLLKKRFDLHVSGFVNRVSDYIYLQPQDEPRLTIRGAFPVFQYVQTDALLWGLDFNSELTIVKHLLWRAQFSVIRARDISNDDYLFGIPSDRIRNELAFEAENPEKRKHSLTEALP